MLFQNEYESGYWRSWKPLRRKGKQRQKNFVANVAIFFKSETYKDFF